MAVHTIVAGMGPAGLTSALALLMKGHDVTIIDKRADYTLTQKVIIPPDLINAFMQLGSNTSFLQKLTNNNGLISLRKFQKFQLDVLKDICKKGIINFQNNSIPIKGKVQILQGANKEIIAADPNLQTITLKNNKKISFDNIIDATGNKRYITSLISKHSKGKYNIAYSSNLPQPEHKANAVICFNTKTNEAKVAPINASNNYSLSVFGKNGWNENRSPIYYLRASATKKSIYLLSEIPNTLVGEKDHHKILNFVKPILKEECGVEKFDIKKNDIKLFLTFNLKHEIADKPYAILGKKGALIVAGDALSPANFHFGHGVSKGIADGLNLLDAFDDKGKLIPSVLTNRTKQIRTEIQEYLDEQNKTQGLKRFKQSGIYYKIKFLFNELMTLETLKIAVKTALLVAPFLLAASFSTLSVGVSALLGTVAFTFMKYVSFYANLTYKIPRVNSSSADKAHTEGEYAEESWKHYLAGFLHTHNYRNYYQYVEGRIEARKKTRLSIK